MAIDEGRLPVGTTSENLDTTKVTQTDGTTVHREAVVITGPDDLAKRIDPEGFDVGLGTKYAMPITGVELKSLCNQMDQLIESQRLTNLYLSRLVGEALTTEDLEDYG